MEKISSKKVIVRRVLGFLIALTIVVFYMFDPTESVTVDYSPGKSIVNDPAAGKDDKLADAPSARSTEQQKRVAAAPVDPPSSPFDQRIQKHGTNAVVRVRGKLGKKAKVKYKLQKPVWDKPYPLTFRKLKKNHQFYRVHEKFFADGLPRIHGGAVMVSGAVMPIDPPGEDGLLKRFWLANPSVVMAGCVFCNPPTMADLIYVYMPGEPMKVDRETLYRSILTMTATGRFFIGPGKSKDGVEYMFSMEMKEVL